MLDSFAPNMLGIVYGTGELPPRTESIIWESSRSGQTSFWMSPSFLFVFECESWMFEEDPTNLWYYHCDFAGDFLFINNVPFLHKSRPRWLSWIRRPTEDQEVAGSTPTEVGNILSWRLIMQYFRRSFSRFR